jgi:Zn-finger nucleic acid-binding protein
MKCLRCESVELEVQARGEGADVIEVDVCPSCHGVWLDAAELAKIDDNFFVDVERMELLKATPAPEDRGLSCPRCPKAPALEKVHPRGHKSLIIDTCPACHGFWLDRGELEKVRDVSDKLLVASLLSLDD